MNVAWSELEIEDTGPCTDCAKVDRCAAERLACIAFRMFAEGASAQRYGRAPRQPDADTYKRIFLLAAKISTAV